MGGSNPFVEGVSAEKPKQKYRMRFVLTDEHTGEQEQHEIEVDPEKLPYGRDGEPGSILDIALGHDIDIDHACGGVCACSTCHVIVREGFDTCNAATDDEEDQLDNAPGLEVHSRLSCQCVPNGTQDVVVEVPAWNRNMVREAPH